MARSAHAYVRGSTAKFYDWLAMSPAPADFPQGPPVWICGDCHLGNLGPIADGDGEVAIQIRDLDQAVIGNPAHDLVRLGLSLATAARGSDLPGVTTARMMEEMMDGYAAAMIDPEHGDPGSEPSAVRSVRRKAWARRWRHLARERLGDETPTIPLGRKFWAIEEEERAALGAMFADPDVIEQVLAFEHAGGDRSLRMIDAAYWMKGCSSLGLLRYAVLLEIRDDANAPRYALMDVKEAIAPIAPAAEPTAMPRDNAQRVVAAARAMSPHLGERIVPVHMMGHAMFIRELTPRDLKLEVDQFSQKQAARAARYLAFVVGKAHARQMDEPTREAWLRQLGADRHYTIDAPSWLWESIVWLAGCHESGYLEHCRRYAMEA